MFPFFANLPIERKLLLVSAVPILAIVILSVVTYKSVETFSDDEDRLNQVYHVQSSSAEYMRLIVDLETGFRGFVLTQQPQFLQPYEAAKKRVLSVGQALQQMVSDDHEQALIIERAQFLIKQLMEDKDHLINRVKEGVPEEALHYIESESGRVLMLSIREEMAKFDRTEIDLMREALASSSADRTVLMGVVVGGGSLALIIMILPLQLIGRSITGPLTALAKTVGDVSGGMIPDVPVLDRQDEIGHLMRVMQSMNIQLRQHIERIEHSENELRGVNQNLAASEAKYRDIVDHAPIGIFTTQGTRMIFSSRQNWTLAGFKLDEDRDPEQLWDAIHPDDREVVRTGFAEAVERNVAFEQVFRFLHPGGGGIRQILSRATPITNSAGKSAVYQGFNVDITALEQMRAKLHRAERLATLGQVAAGIAHEIRNPLVGIGSTTSLLMEDLKEEDPQKNELLVILQETRRLDRIVNQIVDYARPRDLNPTRFIVDTLIHDTLDLLKEPLSDKSIEVICPPSNTLLTVEADPDQIKQVLLNVLHNAIESMPTTGTLQLHLEEEPRNQEKGVSLRIQDSGKGIDPTNLTRIFEPFFTSGKVRGTGLGLAICRNIIEAHRGDIQVKSEVGVGTTITIWLPLAHQPQPVMG
jgi:PAS domain S-box-containing protein